MVTHQLTGSDSPDPVFAQALAAIRGESVRPEIDVTEVPAPTRIAPHAVAFSAEIVPPGGDADDPVGAGRFVLLHDPAAPEPWGGVWRAVTYVRADLDPELGGDPVLADVGWAWLTECLEGRAAPYVAPSGTVTRILSRSFGALADAPDQVELEVRASWTPSADDLLPHYLAWLDLLGVVAGLPTLPEGVVPMSRTRR